MNNMMFNDLSIWLKAKRGFLVVTFLANFSSDLLFSGRFSLRLMQPEAH